LKHFARLFGELDSSTATHAKIDAMTRYFAQVPPADAAWAAYFLAGGKPRQIVATAALRASACEAAGLPEWLFEESYRAAGDLAETIAHVLAPPSRCSDWPLSFWIEQRLLPLRDEPVGERAARIVSYWSELDATGRLLLTKLIGGGFRVGVSKLMVQRSLAQVAALDAKVIAQRMMGYTDARHRPSAGDYLRLVSAQEANVRESGQPYPFFLAHALDVPAAEFAAALGPIGDWQVEWKYDGIRAQVVKRAGRVWIWSRGEELINEPFPDLLAAAAALPDGTVLDGEIVVWDGQGPAAFQLLQTRIARKHLTPRMLSEAPARFIAYDVLEWAGVDRRGMPQFERRDCLEAALGTAPGLSLSPTVSSPDWPGLAQLRQSSRERGVEGFMLKHRLARYGTGRTKSDGTWWKWKVDPLRVDAVLVYAQAGHGRRAGLYTDYTLAVWNRAPANAGQAQAVLDAMARHEPARPDALQLVAFAKAYTGLTDEEIRQVDRVVRLTSLDKFGPVRSVLPSLVFEIGFEAIQRSARHKSGIAVRFPRILRIRDDKPLHEADTLHTLNALLASTTRQC